MPGSSTERSRLTRLTRIDSADLISMMTAKLTGVALTPEVVKYELVNAGIVKLRVSGLGTSGEKWTKLEADAQVRDD